MPNVPIGMETELGRDSCCYSVPSGASSLSGTVNSNGSFPDERSAGQLGLVALVGSPLPVCRRGWQRRVLIENKLPGPGAEQCPASPSASPNARPPLATVFLRRPSRLRLCLPACHGPARLLQSLLGPSRLPSRVAHVP